MKILIVSKCQTHPVNSGSRKFILSQVELFKEMGHEVRFLYVEELALSPANRALQDGRDELAAYWGDRLYIYKVLVFQKFFMNILSKFIRPWFNKGYMKVDDYYPAGLSRFVEKINRREHFDCCIINYYYLSKLFSRVKFPLCAISTHDTFAYQNLAFAQKNMVSAVTAHDEAVAMQRCRHIFALNSEEANYFARLSPLSRVYNVFSIYDFNATPTVGNRVILFLSGLHKFTRDGLDWFVNDVFPLIVREFPDVELRIGGRICDVVGGQYMGRSNIRLVGHVSGPMEFYSEADVAINPTYMGTGLKIKTFEAISYDKVTMVHPHSMTGIFKPDEAPLFASSDPEEWVDFLKRIWGNKAEIEKIKLRNNEYITQMRNFVAKEYGRFFSSLNK